LEGQNFASLALPSGLKQDLVKIFINIFDNISHDKQLDLSKEILLILRPYYSDLHKSAGHN
jgi:hypothetical protein